MGYKFLCLIFTVFCCIPAQVAGQRCDQEYVIPRLSDDYVLTWTPSSPDVCIINHYVIRLSSERLEEEIVITEETSLDVSFVPLCEVSRIILTPILSDDLEGMDVMLFSILPLPSDSSQLGLDSLALTPQNSSVNLEWAVADRLLSCLDEFRAFRVTVYDTDTDNTTDTYLNRFYTGTTIDELVPCASYQIGVAPEYKQADGPATSIRYTGPAAVTTNPRLDGFTVGTTWISFTAQVENYLTNRCVISSIVIDASPAFTVSYPISDQINRPPLLVNLTNLQPDTLYPLSVSVVNSAGTSDSTRVTAQTLDS